MDRDREANTRCTWFTQIGYVHVVEEFSLIVKDVTSFLEVLFLYPGVVSLTDEDAQGLFLNWARGFSGFLQSIRPTQEFEGQNKSIKSRMWYLLWKHKMLKMSTREQCQVRTRPKEKTGKHNMIWDTLAFNPDDMRYSCSGVACLQRQVLSKEIWLSKFGERCLFSFRTSNPVGDLALEIQRTCLFDF
ncbi:hypothetical protein ACFX12_003816 [Malus domestica]